MRSKTERGYTTCVNSVECNVEEKVKYLRCFWNCEEQEVVKNVVVHFRLEPALCIK